MIKFIALITMLLDHIGIVFLPQTFIFRIIGRISMPMFAYCIARGFSYSKQHGTTKRYLLYMLTFALISQFPYILMVSEGMNIGFTWLISLLLLASFTSEKNKASKLIGSALLVVKFVLIEVANLLPVDYGIYGVITPLLFYYLIAHKKESTINYVLILLIGWAIYAFANKGSSGSMAQLVSVASAYILTVSKKYDNKINLPRWVFYAFYPVHMAIFMLIRYL